MNADTGAPCSPRHHKKKAFVDGIKKGLSSSSSSKQLTESAAIACVKLCKASTFINISDSNNVTFQLVQTVIKDLKVNLKQIIECKTYGLKYIFQLLQALLFNPTKPFSRGQAYTCQDVELMIDCWVSTFRINPHNIETLKICLMLSSPPIYHFVIVSALLRYIKIKTNHIFLLFNIYLCRFQNRYPIPVALVAPNRFGVRSIGRTTRAVHRHPEQSHPGLYCPHAPSHDHLANAEIKRIPKPIDANGRKSFAQGFAVADGPADSCGSDAAVECKFILH